ncbi:MAG: CHASE2 domain-containing protein [Armatimonadetes bacterium]|nr:CHASE2 domain-containing protein [Armatimonadota bacterium]
MPLSNPHSLRWKAATIGLFVSLATMLLTHNDLFEGLELKTYDFWFRIRGGHPANPMVVIAAIDDLSAHLFGFPPWPRNRLAKLVEILNRGGARVIAFDMKLSGRDLQSEKNDRILSARLTHSKNVVLATYFFSEAQQWKEPLTDPVKRAFCVYTSPPATLLNEANQMSLPYPPLLSGAAALGHINIYPELDGVVRKAPLVVDFEDKPFPSLALQTVRLSVGFEEPVQVNPGKYVKMAGLRIPIDEGFETMLNFAGGYQTFPYYSCGDLLLGKVDPRVFKDKIVLVGSTAAQQSSAFPTPFTQILPGIEIQATAIDNLLESRPMRRAPQALNLLLLLFLGPALGFILAEQRPTYSWIYAVTVASAIDFTVFYLFAQRLVWIDSVRPLSALFWTYLIVLVYRLRLGEQESARTRSVIDTLMNVSHIVGSSMDQQRLLQSFLNWVTQMLSAEAGSILLFDESRQNLNFEVATGEKSASVSQFSLKVGEGIAGWVAQNGESVIANDLDSDTRFKRDISEEIGYPTRSILCVPLQSKDTILGVIEVLNKKQGSPFTPADQNILEAMANQAGVVLENARLYALLEKKIELANRELLETNRELSVEKGKLEAIVRSMSDGVIVLDSLGKAVFANPAARRLFGMEDTAPMIGRPYEEVIEQSDLREGIRATYTRREEIRIQELKVMETHARVFSAHLAPVRDSGTEMLGVVVVFSDITELKALDRLKSDFVSFVSHELRSPITTIKGFASTLLRSDVNDPESSEEFLQVISQECDRMARLIASILDLSRLEAGRELELHLEEVSIPEAIERVVDRNRLYATRHEFVMDLQPHLPLLPADPDKLDQILTNLVSNAVKYSPHGGEIGVLARQEDSQILISVRDHGIGISPGQLDMLFQRFQRLRGEGTEKIAGTGLGLYLTRHLIRAHGGDIWVESDEGNGSTFRFSLPMSKEESSVP